MSSTFVHLRLHTDYSLVDGTIDISPRTRMSWVEGGNPPFLEERVPGLAEAVAAAGMPAVAVTDQSNLFALVKFYRAAIAAGIKPIVGVDIRLWRDERSPPSRMVLLCQNRTGYLNLTRLISRSYMEGQRHGIPLVERAWMDGASEGLIALSGGRQGDIGQALLADRFADAEALLADWTKLFPGRFYLELQRTGRPQEEDYLHRAVELAHRHATPVVATNDVCFLTRADFEAHEARVCIHDGRTLDDLRRPRNYSEEQYLRSPEEMCELFSDIPEAIENTLEIARRCNLELTLGKNVLPDFPVPEGMTTASFFVQQAREGLERRLQQLGIAEDPESCRIYHERLATEVDVITQMGFPGYFLIVADFIRWAKENGVPVGPGRGSGAGSLVAYALKITDLDPIEHELLFERFLNPERVSLPDFDVDFCMEGRDRVIDYVASRYGRERVSQIITYGSMAAKAVVRDVGRVLGHPYGFVDKIAKLIPFELGITLSKELKAKGPLYERYVEDEETRALVDLAIRLEGMVRNAGKHAGGVVIAPSALTDYTPLYCEQGSDAPVTQFDKDDVESVGLVKFDFLGLRTLTIIDRTVKTVNARGGAIEIESLPMDDQATFDLLKRCATTAIFQLESRGMKDLIKRLQPDCFEDITALVALFRPGPLQSGMVDDFIARKHGQAVVEYPHEDLAQILKPTYGVILYQEQVMQIAQVLAGYSLGQADLLRRAMGKKKPEEMAEQREVFMAGAAKRGVDPDVARNIFDLMEKFAGYGFNKSHSAAYALLSYQTAWLKAHYPAAFMASVMSADMDNTDKVVTLMDECRAMGLAVMPPDINRCDHAFAVHDEQTILYGLGAIKGVGASAIETIVEERAANGPYADLFDLCRRIDLRRANRRVLEALIRSGALDTLDSNRARSMAVLTEAIQYAERSLRDAAVGQDDLFGGGGGAASPVDDRHLEALRAEVPEWSEELRLQGERDTLGLYLTGHPIERYLEELSRFVTSSIGELRPQGDKTVVVAGLLIGIRTMNSKRGDRIAFIVLDDRSARVEVAVFAEAYQRYRDQLVKDRLLVIEGTVSLDEYSGGCRMSAERILGIDEARATYARGIEIDLRPIGNGGVSRSLADALAPFRSGECPVWINYRGASAAARMRLGQEWRVRPTDELLGRLGELAGTAGVRVLY
ncbi:MAG: DNA polymerase III subunit alpha [Gammaproteobacteria bacterium]|jgi:DNA polymerase-3 subunit alpha|nr:DNA polymerase III subunit alpha [Gammaproteobacteria bacterium]